MRLRLHPSGWLAELACLVLMESFACAQTILCVDGDAAGANNCASWADACTDLQHALGVAEPGDQIRVAGGTYRPSERTDPDDQRTATFQLITGVAIYGGYAGFGEPAPDHRDPDIYETILSGDLNADDHAAESNCCFEGDQAGCDDGDCEEIICATVPDCCEVGWAYFCAYEASRLCCDLCGNKCENAYHIVVATDVDATAILDGFTLSGGRAEPRVFGDFGGGAMLNYNAGPTVANCTFRDNTAFGRYYVSGGAMWNYDNASPVIINCKFFGNLAHDGGAIANVHTWPGRPRLTNCLFSGNRALWCGGAVANFSGRSPIFTNCTFAGNTARIGGGLFSDGTGVVPVLTNCILWGNWDRSGTGPSSQINDSSALLYYNCIQGWEHQYDDLYRIGNIGDDPMFVDANGPDGIPGTEDDDLQLSPGSSCINTGDPGFTPEPGATDLGGQPRLQGCRVDMGVFETDTLQPMGDFDSDGTVTLHDFAFFQGCFDAHNSVPDWLDACMCSFDFDGSETIDLDDYAGFNGVLAGPDP